MEVRKTIDEMKSRMPWIRYRVIEPRQVDAAVAKLGYDKWFDRCKYDVITFHEEGREKALLIWNVTGGPDRRHPEKPWKDGPTRAPAAV